MIVPLFGWYCVRYGLIRIAMLHANLACLSLLATRRRRVPGGACASGCLRCVYQFDTMWAHPSNHIAVAVVWHSLPMYCGTRTAYCSRLPMGKKHLMTLAHRLFAMKHRVRRPTGAIYSAILSLRNNISFYAAKVAKIMHISIPSSRINNFLTYFSYWRNNFPLLLHRFWKNHIRSPFRK